MSGITLVALVVTIVILLILAGITIVYVMGNNGVFGQATQAKIQTELGKIEEQARMIYSDKLMESTSSSLNTKVETSEVILQLISEGYNNIKKKSAEKGGITEISLDKESMTIGLGKTAEIHINYKDVEESDTFDYYVEVQGKYYEMQSNNGYITIDRKASTLTKADFENEEGGTNATFTVSSSKQAVATAKLKEGSINTIEVTALNVEDSTEITVTYGKFEPLKCIVTVADLEIEEAKAFSRANGVIDIVWLNTDNTVRTESEGPLSPKDYLGNLTAIKYNGTKWVKADSNNAENSWYHYEAQTGNTDGKTSNWANAVANFNEAKGDGDAYFVWIPRYAYKITYFKESTDAEAYRADRNSKKGIIGYSNINGLVDVSTGIEKLVKESEPTNVTGKVENSQYADYIPHPAFQFDEAKAGIWVGKFDSSGTQNTAISEGAVKIVPNTEFLNIIKVGDIFTACQKVKEKYKLEQSADSHLMKNTEWGAVSYLAESKYGRNGKEIAMNSSNFITGEENYVSNVEQSTTGNIYGIYDMSGGRWEYVAGVLDSKLSVDNYYDFTTIDSKYYNAYTNYSDSKKIKGDAVFETSTTGINSTSWHSDYSYFLITSYPVFARGRFSRR